MADEIKVLKGLEAVRKKPSMYIGPIDSNGVFTIVREVMDNAVDEFVAKRGCTEMYVSLYEDGWVAVHDNGRGIPVTKHETEGIPVVQVAVGMLHAGGKLEAGDGNYSASRGTHGIGVSATNALSKEFVVLTRPKGKAKWHRTEYEKGKLTLDTEPVTNADDLGWMHPVYEDQGTSIFFLPDNTIFDKGSKLAHDEVHGGQT